MNKKRNYKKGLRQVPKYIPLVIWLGFTIAMIGWILMASLSTTSEIYSDSILSSGFHLENYINVMKKHKLGIYFMNSLIYCIVGCVGIVLISAPAAYALSRIKFKGKHIVNNIFVIGR
jgi:N-acetylglucosamine transport system permease protein